MRHLHTIACVTVLALTTLSPQAIADYAGPEDERLTNAAVLQWDETEQRLWLRALALGIASGISLADADAGECVSRWYFGDEAQNLSTVREAMAQFPDHTPQAIIGAYARRACPGVSALVEG